MATPKEKLADALEALQALQRAGVVAIRSRDLGRTDRERLLKSGFLREAIKGWYYSSRPDEAHGDSTAWYASFWDFCAAYLSQRFGRAWCLAPEQSLSLHAGNRSVPAQLLVRAPKGGNKPTTLPHRTSLFDVRNAMPDDQEIVQRDGLRLFSAPAALVTVSEDYFRRRPTDARAAMATIADASDVLALLLRDGRSTIAGRLAGAFRNVGRARMADEIVKAMRAAGYTVRETDPFETVAGPALVRQSSPYVNRLRLMWAAMRTPVMDAFPAAPRVSRKPNEYLKSVDDAYASDAYHSLSIEGYRVSPGLIERVRRGRWNPDRHDEDRDNQNALAARGYYQGFLGVRGSIGRVLRGDNAGLVAKDDTRDWYRQLFGPSVTAGIVAATHLAGYRTTAVYIRRSMHVPPPPEAVRDCMPAFFDLLEHEAEAAVRVVLGHFVFVYIHPYTDGNGRMGRFLMNVMLASGGYPWTVIPLERRDDYMRALESASVTQRIEPFAAFLAGLVQARLRGRLVPAVPPAGG
jgi:hypothetical protein